MDGKIYEAISAVMADVGAVGKDAVNKTQGFKYRGIDAVMNALNPAMVKHKVFCVPEVLEQKREERQTKTGGCLIYSICRVKFTFFTTDGSHVEAVTVGEGMDSGDKATNKAMAIAFKYACFQTFCIQTEEMKDPDEESHSVTGSRAAPKTPKDETVAGKVVNRIGADEVSSVDRLVKKRGVDPNKILSMFRVSLYNEMTWEQYHSCMSWLSQIGEQ